MYNGFTGEKIIVERDLGLNINKSISICDDREKRWEEMMEDNTKEKRKVYS